MSQGLLAALLLKCLVGFFVEVLLRGVDADLVVAVDGRVWNNNEY